MSRERTEGAAGALLEKVLAACGGRIGQDGLPEGGAVLLLVAECRRQGLALEGPLLARAAAVLSVDAGDLRQVDEFFGGILAGGDTPGPLAFCRGLSCTLRGADRFHSLVREALATCGVDREIVEVFCLSQCEQGPSVLAGQHIYCSGACRVVTDQRTWRPEDAGPVPLPPP